MESNGTVQSTQMTQMAQEMQICSKRLKDADGGGADSDFLSACFRLFQIRMGLLRFMLQNVALEIKELIYSFELTVFYDKRENKNCQGVQS